MPAFGDAQRGAIPIMQAAAGMAAAATRVIGQFVNPPRKPVDAVSTTDRVMLRFVELLQRARLSADKSSRIRLTGRQQGLRLLPETKHELADGFRPRQCR